MVNYENRNLRFVLTALIIIASVLLFISCSPEKFSGQQETITVAYSPYEDTALLWIAMDRQYFSRNGIDVNLVKYDTGATSLTGALNGEADIVIGVTEFPVVKASFKVKDIAILASIDEGEYVYFVGSKDSGIEKPLDLKGKKVGTVFGTISEFYLGRYLELNGMGAQDVALVDLKTPDEWVSSVVNGDVDAVVLAQPDANKVKESLGGNYFFWQAQSGQSLFGLVVSTGEWAANHPEIIKRFLKSIADAEQYVNSHPAESKIIVQKGLNLDSAYVETVWQQNRFGLTLDQSLLLAMEDEARWMIDNGLTPEKNVPNYLDIIFADGLKSIKPDAVKISGK